ncbi:MAG: response regulator [Polyangiaceae bacterium]|nr:response regulator [Myxococcales bacterium]MCB9584849.1 response regulator [Polyangiaceae bacterium]MCB9607578.1 response regulator [Polyangiaceae bacterium]
MTASRVRRSLRVLVIDDDEVDRLSIRRALTRGERDYDLVEAETAEQALERAADPTIDCILLDNRLPDGDALEVLGRLKQAGVDRPIVVLTGQGHEELAVELLKGGAADYLTKTASPDRIEAALRNAVRVFRSEQKARRAEDALRTSRESLATTLRSVADGVITTDGAGNVTYLNPAAARYCQLEAEECLGKQLWSVLNVEDQDRPAQRDRMDSALTRRLLGSPTELVLRTREGERITVQERVSLMMGADRQTPTGLVLTLTDITDRRRNEERLEFLLSVGNDLARGLDFRRTLETAVRAAVPRLARGCILGVAPQGGGWSYAVEPGDGKLAELAQRLYGADATRGEAIATLVRKGELLVIPPGNTSEAVPDLAEWGVRYTAWLPLTTRFSVGLLLLESPVPWRRDELSLARDFVQRVGLALDNALLVWRLEESVRIRDETLAVVSHDLRSPLNALALATDNLVEESESEDAEDYGEIVQRSISRMNRLIQDLLDAETMASGRFSVNPEACELDGVIEEILQIHEPLADAKGLDFRIERAAELPAVEADRHRLVQVLSNLLGNALKFTQAGSVRLMVDVVPDGVSFAVQDSGPGISSEHQPLLFERFWRADRKSAGSGLGLAIVRGVLLAHQSDIRVDSKPGEGSRFSFTLRRADMAQRGLDA